MIDDNWCLMVIDQSSRLSVGAGLTNSANVVRLEQPNVTVLSKKTAPAQFEFVVKVSATDQQSGQRQVSAALVKNSTSIVSEIGAIDSHRNRSSPQCVIQCSAACHVHVSCNSEESACGPAGSQSGSVRIGILGVNS